MSDAELIAFSRQNRPFQIERNAERELGIMSLEHFLCPCIPFLFSIPQRIGDSLLKVKPILSVWLWIFKA